MYWVDVLSRLSVVEFDVAIWVIAHASIDARVFARLQVLDYALATDQAMSVILTQITDRNKAAVYEINLLA
jgi:hypothetical protein